MNYLKTGKILIAFIILGFLVLLSGCGSAQGYKASLEIWGPFDGNEVYAKFFTDYKKANPFINEIRYRKFSVDNYKRELIDALAAGQGPDMFFIQNNWLPYFKNKVEAAPIYVVNEKMLRDNFVDVVSEDFLDGGKVWGLPLSVDSLALYYNKDLLNAEGIARPPATWEEFIQDIRKLTKIDRFGNIVQSGAAIGTAYNTEGTQNINRATDILGLIMLQKGTQMTDENRKSAIFDKGVLANNEFTQPGRDALNFYTEFSRLASPNYTWNSNMHYSIDSFSENNLAMMFNYSWHYQTIKNKNAKLNFAVAPIPQFAGTQPVSFANYWGLVVSKSKTVVADPRSKFPPPSNEARILESWEFLKYLNFKNNGIITLTSAATGKTKDFPLAISDPASQYLKSTQRPAARRDIIEEQKNDPILAPFASGNLIAKSWYEVEPESIEAILSDAIDLVNKGSLKADEALKVAASKISQLMRQ